MKSDFRAGVKRAFREKHKIDLENKTLHILQHLNSLDKFRRAKNVALYSSILQEVDVMLLLKNNMSASKNIYLPKLNENHMIFMAFNVGESLEYSHLGFLEPNTGAVINPKDIECMIIPGLAFDYRGHRLGRGKGYYDTYLREVSPQCLKIGVGFAFQVFPAVPVEAHDIPMNVIVTEREVIRCD